MKRARFKYYMPKLVDDIEPFAVYSITFPNKKGHSDVSGEILLKLGQPIPLTPDYKTWRRLVSEKKRCGRCFAAIRGFADLEHHMSVRHRGAAIYLPQEDAYETPKNEL